MGRVVLKTDTELETMNEANAIVHRVLDGVAARIAPGVSTAELDEWAEAEIRALGAAPSFLGYHGFPATLCVAVNDVVVHGIPNDRPLEDGDIVSVDCGVCWRGFHGDAARTFPVGRVSPEAARLVRVAEEALERAVAVCLPGNRLGDIGAAIEQWVTAHGYAIIEGFTGHGIGRRLHEAPNVPNRGRAGRGLRLRPGVVLAIEPMIAAGRGTVRDMKDGWTTRTKDGSLAAHAEVSVAITDAGPWVLGVERQPYEHRKAS
ncbi:MAG: type I methionyl aminopeptidase [Acidobacteriota bacterium]